MLSVLLFYGKQVAQQKFFKSFLRIVEERIVWELLRKCKMHTHIKIQKFQPSILLLYLDFYLLMPSSISRFPGPFLGNRKLKYKARS